jgi:hypothetical protein
VAEAAAGRWLHTTDTVPSRRAWSLQAQWWVCSVGMKRGFFTGLPQRT